MKKLGVLTMVGFALIAAGCGGEKSDGEPNTPMGDSAPAFASDMKAFIIGAWSPVEMGDVNLNKKWIFKEDGTFIFHTEDPWRAQGTWSVVENQVGLEYKTMDGVPWAEAQAKVQKAEEGGGQAAIAEALGMRWVFEDLPSMMRIILDDDKKHLKFSNASAEPEPEPPAGTGAPTDPNIPDMGSFDLDDLRSIQIERLK